MNKLRLFHPFIFAIYPVLFLFSNNINRFKEDVLIAPLMVSLVFAGTIYLICTIMTRKPEISAIISSLLIFIFFSYSRLKEPLNVIRFNVGDVLIGSDKIAFACIILSLGFIFFLIFHIKHLLKKINKALFIFSLILLVVAVYNLVSSEIKMGKVFLSGLISETSQLEAPTSTQTPDIYYIILDRYAGDRTLKDYGFDNSDFYNFLRSKGFYIASDSTSNYPKTFLSIGSTLNMEYLDFLTQKTNGGATSSESIVTPLVQNNKVMRFLKSKGYTYIHVGSGWDPTRSNPYADRNFVMNGGRYPFADEFTSGLLHTTLASPILKEIYLDATAVSQDPKYNEFRSRIYFEFDAFNQIPEIPGPKFVFAHILIPHNPHVVGKDCEPLDEEILKSRSWMESYLNQMQCANKKTKEAVDKILASAKTKPVIIIQADEGPMPIKNPISNVDWGKASDASISEKFPILNAYLLPDIKTNPMYSSITPVNTFRILFNTYFNTNLPILPDRNIIFEDGNNYYKFIDVTERLKSISGTRERI